MVSNDVMRLEVKRLRDTLNGAADEVFSLENRRQQLAMSMKERKAEIQVITITHCLPAILCRAQLGVPTETTHRPNGGYDFFERIRETVLNPRFVLDVNTPTT